MKNSADLGECYPPRPSASVDNTLLDLQNSSYPTQPHSIIAKYSLSRRRIIVLVWFQNWTNVEIIIFIIQFQRMWSLNSGRCCHKVGIRLFHVKRTAIGSSQAGILVPEDLVRFIAIFCCIVARVARPRKCKYKKKSTKERRQFRCRHFVDCLVGNCRGECRQDFRETLPVDVKMKPFVWENNFGYYIKADKPLGLLADWAGIMCLSLHVSVPCCDSSQKRENVASTEDL